MPDNRRSNPPQRAIAPTQVSNYPDPRLEQAMWELFEYFEEEMKFREPYDPIAKLHAGLAPNNFQPGQYTELARVEDDLIWAMVESFNLSSSFATRTRYALTADPMGQQSLSTVTLDSKWRRTTPPPSP